MACFKLSSCTAGFSTVIYSNEPSLAALSSVSIATYPGICFLVETVAAPCPCGPIDSFTVDDILGPCECTAPYLCYKLQDCTNPLAPYVYVTGGLYPYIGTTVSVGQLPGKCYNVIGVSNFEECTINTPIAVTCVQNCTCNLYCYEFTNCLNPTEIIQVNSSLPLTINHVVSPTPAITPPSGNNCWIITAINVQPCNPSYGITVTSVIDYGLEGCSVCAGPPSCYQLTSCDGQTTVYTQSSLGGYVGGPSIQTSVFPGQCWIVTAVPPGDPCYGPVVIDPLSISYCTCPCYRLKNCRTNEIIYTHSSIAAYVGQNVHLVEYGGCSGDCWLVGVNPTEVCTPSVTVTVATECTPCGSCGQTCYDIVDCETDVVLVTALNPTLNGVDLSTLLGGQAISQIVFSETIYNGCWYVKPATSCVEAVSLSVYNIYQPTVTQTGCQQCLSSCYGLLNCQTLEIDYVIKYTSANPYGLPDPSTITGTIGDICFESPVGCVSGCYKLQLIPGPDCAGSVDWTTVVSYNSYDTCDDCVPKCYLLTECAPAVSEPFVVSNDLSLYVGSIVKICDDLGTCHCYHVDIAQSCDGAIVINNPNAGFISCEECNACGCPPGYTKVGAYCQKITESPAIPNSIIYTATQGDVSDTYGNLGTRFYDNITFLPYPLVASGVIPTADFIDAGSTPVPFVSNTTGVWNGPIGSRLNTVGVWTTASPNPLNEWIGFSYCLNAAQSGTYCIGIGGDDQVRVKIDGALAAESTITAFASRYWHVFEITLTPGTHIIILEGKNTGGSAAFGAEIYNTTSAILQTLTTSAQLQTVTLFSTFSKKSNNSSFETGENSGYSCPDGASYSNCGEPTCTVIETVPYVNCPPSYKVIDCTGELPDFITNTHLSPYVGGTYKVCIDNPQYNPDCYYLVDCNRLAQPIHTNTNLSSHLWNTVQLDGYPGSCFIVNGVPVGSVCLDPIPVTLIDAQPCNCPGAQQPWPNGCYCVRVEEVIPPVIGIEFTGVFQQSYGCCEDCTRVCYLLTSCNAPIEPVVVCNDLSRYVGQVIQITGCGDICWQVSISDTCDSDIKFGGDIIVYENCEECLPPVPPPPPPYELHLRKIKPGYNSPNSCYTTEYIEKINCGFAQQVYNAMLVKRYGITVCCEEDLNTWDIKKQLMDLDILKDPSMCKSTLCDCKAPCLISAVVTVLPYCGDPSIIAVTTNIPCPSPVLIDAVIDVPIEPAPCHCYSVAKSVITDVKVLYYDCCCQLVSLTITDPATHFFCATTPPVSPDDPTFIIVADSGPCAFSDICSTVTRCYCYTVANGGEGILSITYINCDGLSIDMDIRGVTYICAQENTIQIRTGLGIISGGTEPCIDDASCALCTCNIVKVFPNDIAPSIDYIDCSGTPVSLKGTVDTGYYLCAKGTISVTPGIQVIPLDIDCALNICEEVCQCISISNPSTTETASLSYLDCNNLLQTVSVGPTSDVSICGKLQSLTQDGPSIILSIGVVGPCPCIL